MGDLNTPLLFCRAGVEKRCHRGLVAIDNVVFLERVQLVYGLDEPKSILRSENKAVRIIDNRKLV